MGISVRQVLIGLIKEGKNVAEIEKILPSKVDVSKLKVDVKAYVSRVKNDKTIWGGKSFVVQSKDVMDVKKNPTLSLSPKAILKNKKIPKTEVKTHQQEIKEAKQVLKGGIKVVKITCCKCKRTYTVRTSRIEIYTDQVRKNYVCAVCKRY